MTVPLLVRGSFPSPWKWDLLVELRSLPEIMVRMHVRILSFTFGFGLLGNFKRDICLDLQQSGRDFVILTESTFMRCTESCVLESCKVIVRDGTCEGFGR